MCKLHTLPAYPWIPRKILHTPGIPPAPRPRPRPPKLIKNYKKYEKLQEAFKTYEKLKTSISRAPLFSMEIKQLHKSYKKLQKNCKKLQKWCKKATTSYTKSYKSYTKSYTKSYKKKLQQATKTYTQTYKKLQKAIQKLYKWVPLTKAQKLFYRILPVEVPVVVSFTCTPVRSQQNIAKHNKTVVC